MFSQPFHGYENRQKADPQLHRPIPAHRVCSPVKSAPSSHLARSKAFSANPFQDKTLTSSHPHILTSSLPACPSARRVGRPVCHQAGRTSSHPHILTSSHPPSFHRHRKNPARPPFPNATANQCSSALTALPYFACPKTCNPPGHALPLRIQQAFSAGTPAAR